MKPAEVSLAVRMNSTELRRNDSINGSTGPLGTPKTQCTPAASSIRTKRSEFFMCDLNRMVHWQATIKGRALRSECRGFQFNRSKRVRNVKRGTLNLEHRCAFAPPRSSLDQ